MKIRFICLVIALSTVIASCDDDENPSKGPQVCFTYAQGDLYAMETRFFDASCSSNYDSIRWYMGDGSIISSESHNYAYKTSGDYTISIVAYKGIAKDSVTKAIKVLKPTVFLHVNEPIWKDIVWEKGIHEVDGFVSVVEGTLTIPPGTVIRMRPGAVFQVGTQSPSGLIAEGTAEEPITFTSSLENPVAGSWNHVIVGQYKTLASFKHVIFEYGGEGPYDALLAAQYGASFSAQNCIFRHSATEAINLRDKSFFDLFQNNTISDIAGFAIRMDPYKVSTIGAGNTIDNKGILLVTGTTDQDLRIDKDLTLTKQTAPYAFTQNVVVGSAEGSTLTVEAGASLALDGKYMWVGPGSTTMGSIVLAGTASDSVIVAGLSPEGWGGVQIDNYPAGESVIRYAHLKHAKTFGLTDAVAHVGSVPVTIENSKFSGDKYYGVDFDYGSIVKGFSNNVVSTGTRYAMRVTMAYLPVIGKSNIFENGEEVFLRGADLITEPNTVWQNLGVPYYIETSVTIGNNDGTASLIVEPGTTVRMKANTRIHVGGYSPVSGSMKAIGTPTQKITFTLAPETATTDYPHWVGFYFTSTVGAGTEFSYVTVSNAENGMDMSSTPAGLPVVSNSLFKDITEWGLYCWTASPTASNNTYVNCTLGTSKCP